MRRRFKYGDVPTITCPKCGTIFTGRPAVSREKDMNICPDCGIREALTAMNATEEDIEHIIYLIHRYERTHVISCRCDETNE